MEFLSETSAFYTLVHNIFSFVFILSAIVFIHEYGHYWVAKKCGVKIESFSIGFGKEIFGWNDKSGTRWKVSYIPLGGYVKMYGDENAASTPDKKKLKKMTEEERRISFHTQALWKRFLIVLAGPAANYIFAIIVIAIFFSVYGKPFTAPIVSGVQKDSAAETVGLQIGDKIISVDGDKVKSFEQIKGIVSLHPDIEIELSYEREGKVIETNITPKKQSSKDIFGDEVEIGLIGISSEKMEYRKLTPMQGVHNSFLEVYDLSAKTLQALGQIVTGQRSSDQISGILRIADYSGKSVEQGIRVVVWFMAILSVNLGLVNLFPIPMLDGGHLLLYIIEGVRGKPMSDKAQDYLFKFGFALLIALMLFATFNDLKYFKIF